MPGRALIQALIQRKLISSSEPQGRTSAALREKIFRQVAEPSSADPFELFTLICFGREASDLGRRNFSIPFLNSATALSESTLAGRAELWQELLAMHTNPIIGVGFESFWLGDRLATLAENHWWHPTEAHNGYLETYLSMGIVGLVIVLGLIIATFRKARSELLRNFEFGSLRLGLLITIVLYNWTEAAFKGLSLLWFVFYIIAIDYHRARRRGVASADVPNHTEPELAYTGEQQSVRGDWR